MRNAPVANVTPEGEVEMISAADSRAAIDSQDDIPAIDRMYNSDAWVQAQRDAMEESKEEKKSNKMKKSELKEIIRAAFLNETEEKVEEGTWAVLPARIPEFIQAVEDLKDEYHGVVGSDDVFDGLDAAISAAEELLMNTAEIREAEEDGEEVTVDDTEEIDVDTDAETADAGEVDVEADAEVDTQIDTEVETEIDNQNIEGADPTKQSPNSGALKVDLNATADSIFNPNAALSALNTYLTMNNVANKMFGIEARWFRAVPQERSKDVIFQEWTLYCVEETPFCIKVLLPDGTFPDSKYQYDLMGLEYEVPLEIHIDKRYWEENKRSYDGQCMTEFNGRGKI